MTVAELLAILRDAPIIASVQASPDSPCADPQVLLAMAKASLANGVKVLRLEGVNSIRLIRSETKAPTIGLIKREIPGSPVYITPEISDVDALVELGCEIIAFDATGRRPHQPLIRRIHAAGRLAMADCDDIESAVVAALDGADLVSTTLAGYTTSATTPDPDLDSLYEICTRVKVPVLAEGRYLEPWQTRASLAIGACGVVIGGALNDPVKQTRRFVKATCNRVRGLVVDLGGTWLRTATLDEDGQISDVQAIPRPDTGLERLAVIRDRANGLEWIGISSGGTIAPRIGYVMESTSIIPDHQGTSFSVELPGFKVRALNDGLATAWAHAHLPTYAGSRVATLALGTGVGFGMVDRGRLLMGRQGEYPRINDMPLLSRLGVQTAEEILGASSNADDEQKLVAARGVITRVLELYMPDHIVLAGSLGLALAEKLKLPASPYGKDAGLYGAASLLQFPIESD